MKAAVAARTGWRVGLDAGVTVSPDSLGFCRWSGRFIASHKTLVQFRFIIRRISLANTLDISLWLNGVWILRGS
jgi:hypothetical protein